MIAESPCFNSYSNINNLFDKNLKLIQQNHLPGTKFINTSSMRIPSPLALYSYYISIVHINFFISVTVLLILVSQRVEIPIPGLWDKVETDLDKIQLERRGAPATMVEWMILAYVAGKDWLKALNAAIYFYNHCILKRLCLPKISDVFLSNMNDFDILKIF